MPCNNHRVQDAQGNRYNVLAAVVKIHDALPHIVEAHPPDLFFRNCKFLAMMDVAIAREIGGLPSSQ